MKARLRPLALQATAAERAEKLRGEIAGLRARVGASSTWPGSTSGSAEVEERRAAAAPERSAPASGSRRCWPSATASRRSSRPRPGAATGRPRRSIGCAARAERLELRRDAARELADRLRAEPLLPRTRANPEREALHEQARLARERLAGARALARRARRACRLPRGHSPEEGERLALSLLEVEAGYERAAAAALGQAAPLRSSPPTRAPRSVSSSGRARPGSAIWRVLVPPRGGRSARRGRRSSARSRCRAVSARGPAASGSPSCWPTSGWPSPPSSSGRESGVLVTREVTASTPSAASSGSPARRRRRSCCSSTRAAARWPRRSRSSSAVRRSCPPRRRRCRPAAGRARRASRVRRWQEAAGAAERFEAPLRARVDAGATRAGELAAELRRLGGEEAEVAACCRGGRRARRRDRRRARASRGRGATRRGGGSRRPEPSPPRATTARSSPRGSSGSSARRETLGQVNPLAKEEYDAREGAPRPSSRRSAPTSRRASTELEQLRDELAETVERRFDETFAAVSAHFEEVAATLFPGGEGRLRLDRARRRTASEAGRRGRAPAGRQARHAAVAALGRREGARRDLVPVRALPRAAVPVLPARRGRGRARRRQHRPLRRAAAPLRRARAVHRRHAPEADDGGRRRALRRDDGRRRRLSDRLRGACRAKSTPRPSRSALRPGCVRAAHARALGTTSGCARRSGRSSRTLKAAFDPAGLWPANEWDVWGSTPPLKGLYCGAGGVIWALDALVRRGHAETGIDLAAAAERTLELWREAPDLAAAEIELPSARESSLLCGEAGLLLVNWRLTPRGDLADRLLPAGPREPRQRVRGAAVGLTRDAACSAGDV